MSRSSQSPEHPGPQFIHETPRSPCFNLKTGLRLTYDASDKLGNKWQMTMQVQGQVTFGGHTYFRVPKNQNN